MAHVERVKMVGLNPMVGHYAREAERRGFHRDNIDAARTPLNYAVGADGVDALAARVRERVSEAVRGHETASGKGIRKDANVVMDWVVTRPQDCPEELTGAFFEAVVCFIQDRYGEENVPGGFVHMDEMTPHVHVPVVPVRDGRLQASKVVDRSDLKSFHGQLGRAVDAALGVHVSIELDESRQGEKQLSRLSQPEYVAARARLAELGSEVRAEYERLESVQAARRAVERRGRVLGGGYDEAIGAAEGALGGADAALGRAGELVEECESALASSLAGPGLPTVAASRDREEQARAEVVSLGDRVRQLGDRLRALGERLVDLRDRLAESVRGGFRAWGLFSSVGRGVARPVAEASYPAPAELAEMLGAARDAVARAPRVAPPAPGHDARWQGL